MSTVSTRLTVSGIGVDVVFKDIKHLHIGVYPPNGRVRVAAPNHVDADLVRLAVVRRLAWIKRKQSQLAGIERQAEREMVTGESHYVWGRRLRLRVIRRPGRSHVETDGANLLLFAPDGTSPDRRRRLLDEWHREQLRMVIPDLVQRWAEKLEIPAPEWRIRRMKTKWGSCNRENQRVWLNVALALKRPDCLEYVVPHEIAHLRVRNHGPAFTRLMDNMMPNWTSYRKELNRSPFAPFNWPTVTSSGGVD